MEILANQTLTGDLVGLKTTRSNHISGMTQKAGKTDQLAGGYANTFSQLFNQVNNLEHKSNDMAVQMATEPDSVNLHDVMIAAEQAGMAVTFTKSVVDKVISAYREMTRMR